MSGNILKTSDCINCNDYLKIYSFCINCPSLMCCDCEKKIHVNLRHSIIKFKKNSLQLECNKEESILKLFDDRQFGINVFQEINRKTELDIGDDDRWHCSSCTLMNPSKNTKCDACSIYRKTTDDDVMQYNGKLEGLLKKMSVLESELYEYENVTFEHVAKEYLISSDYYPDFGRWFQEKYLVDKELAIVNDIVANAGHNITRQQLSEKYEEFVKIHNRSLIKRLPPSLLTDNVINSRGFIDLMTVNKRNIIPEGLTNGKIDKEYLWNVIFQDEDYTEHQIRMIMTEMNLPSPDKVQLLWVFIRDESLGQYLRSTVPLGTVTIEDIHNALMDSMTIVEGMEYLVKECSLCNCEFPTSKMHSMLTCQHELCKTCFKCWLEETIVTKFPYKWGCSICKDNKYDSVDRNLHIFNLRNFIDENKLSEKIVQTFDLKLLFDRLKDSKTFHWCRNDQCEFGFEAEGIRGKAQCPSCKGEMCLDCNRKWNSKHENVTCQEYNLLMIKDDPSLANALKDIGLECPKCRTRYALAAGGCLHFECTSCGAEFCGGCYTVFTKQCQVVGCTMGTAFHGHHPRNCIYFLRDEKTEYLANMLEKSEYPRLKNKPEKQCPFIITDKGTMKDRNCNDQVYDTSGLCELHYKEYLVMFINILKIDPADFANSDDLNLMLSQALQPQLKILPDETDDQFVARLTKEVKKCPLYIPMGFMEQN